MKRRDFIKIAAVVPVAAAVDPLAIAQIPPTRPPQGPPPGGFPGRNAGPAVYEPTGPGIQVRFLGTGGADWRGPAANGELRRHASILADGKVLFDYTASAADMVPDGQHPEVIFYTHSHDDHFDPRAALELGIRRVYVGNTWTERALADFRKADDSTGKTLPEIQQLLDLSGGKDTGGARTGHRERTDAALTAAGGEDQSLKVQFCQSFAGGQNGEAVSGYGKDLGLRQQSDTGELQSGEKQRGIFRPGLFRTESCPAEARVTALTEDAARSGGAVHKDQVTDAAFPGGGCGGHPRGTRTDDQKFTVFHLRLHKQRNRRRIA